jgi:hypothetical protein
MATMEHRIIGNISQPPAWTISNTNQSLKYLKICVLTTPYSRDTLPY